MWLFFEPCGPFGPLSPDLAVVVGVMALDALGAVGLRIERNRVNRTGGARDADCGEAQSESQAQNQAGNSDPGNQGVVTSGQFWAPFPGLAHEVWKAGHLILWLVQVHGSCRPFGC
jgi:hypothetical protein